MLKLLLFFSLLALFQPTWADIVRIGTSDTELELAHLPSLTNISVNLMTSSPFDLVTEARPEPYFSHGTLSFLTIFSSTENRLGTQFLLVSMAQVGRYPTVENLGENNKYQIGTETVYNKQDNGKKFFETHMRAGAQVIYIGWPLNAGNAKINSAYLAELVRRNVILVEVAPTISEEREFIIADDDKYTLKVGAVGHDGRVLESSRITGVDIFCPATITLEARSYVSPSGKVSASFGDTSAAAAICTRYVAQLKAIKPDINLEEMRELLSRTSSPPPQGATAGVINFQSAMKALLKQKGS